jgi:hypothetical protein
MDKEHKRKEWAPCYHCGGTMVFPRYVFEHKCEHCGKRQYNGSSYPVETTPWNDAKRTVNGEQSYP